MHNTLEIELNHVIISIVFGCAVVSYKPKECDKLPAHIQYVTVLSIRDYNVTVDFGRGGSNISISAGFIKLCMSDVAYSVLQPMGVRNTIASWQSPAPFQWNSMAHLWMWLPVKLRYLLLTCLLWLNCFSRIKPQVLSDINERILGSASSR